MDANRSTPVERARHRRSVHPALGMVVMTLSMMVTIAAAKGMEAVAARLIEQVRPPATEQRQAPADVDDRIPRDA